MIRVLVVDDHPAVRAGLVGLLRSEPGFVAVGAAANAADGLEQAERSGPNVVLLDYDLPDHDGLLLCCDLKALPSPPGVIVYSAFARPRLAPAAAVAGTDAMVDKGALTDELFETLRRVARGVAEPLSASPAAIERCLARLHPDDIPLFGMAINGTPTAEIAAVAGDDLATTRSRLRALVRRLQTTDEAASVADD
jgi:DNA-binding NarL/FixJ family response regulator